MEKRLVCSGPQSSAGGELWEVRPKRLRKARVKERELGGGGSTVEQQEGGILEDEDWDFGFCSTICKM